MAFELLEGPNGTPVTAKGTIEGYLQIAIESGGIGGDASAANQDEQTTLLTSIETLVTTTNTKLAGGLPTALGAGGGLKVDGSGTPLPVSGTVSVAGAAPHADATTDVYTRFPTLGTANVAFASGVAILKATAGRVRQLQIHYTDATASGLYVQLHNAATATAPTDATWVLAWPINSGESVIDFLSQIDIPCTAGIKLAFSSTRLTYTAATTENGAAVGYGA